MTGIFDQQPGMLAEALGGVRRRVGDEQDVLVLNFKQMATAADISFNALTFTKREGGTLPSVTISGGFTGTSANIIRFLKMIEVNPRKLVIRDAGVSRSETVGGLELVSLNLTIEAFFRSQS